MMLLDVILSFGAPKTVDILENDKKGNYGGFVFQIEILGCQVEKKEVLVVVTSVL